MGAQITGENFKCINGSEMPIIPPNQPTVFMMSIEYNVYGGGSSVLMSYQPDGDGNWYKNYYIRDHLGNLRLTLKDIGGGNHAITGKYDYEPFGKRTTLSNFENNRTGFIGKERDAESSLGDFGVRKYDPYLGRFTLPDPLWEKYVSLTPYQYAGNNPVISKDIDGKKIFIEYGNADGSTSLFQYEYGKDYSSQSLPPFVADVINSFNYLFKDKTGRSIMKTNQVIKELAETDKGDVKIGINMVKHDYNPESKKILYDPYSGFIPKDGRNKVQIPALGLWHELGHAYRQIIEGIDVRALSEQLTGDEYYNKEEKAVIKNFETPVAKRLHEEWRETHWGTEVEVSGPTKTK